MRRILFFCVICGGFICSSAMLSAQSARAAQPRYREPKTPGDPTPTYPPIPRDPAYPPDPDRPFPSQPRKGAPLSANAPSAASPTPSPQSPPPSSPTPAAGGGALLSSSWDRVVAKFCVHFDAAGNQEIIDSCDERAQRRSDEREAREEQGYAPVPDAAILPQRPPYSADSLEILSSKVDAFPVPTFGNLTIRWLDEIADMIRSVRMYYWNPAGILGEEVALPQSVRGGGSLTIQADISRYRAGYYMIHIELYSGQRIQKRIIKN